MSTATQVRLNWFDESVAALGIDPMADAAVFSGLSSDPWFTGLDQLPERFTLEADEPEQESVPEEPIEEPTDPAETQVIVGTLMESDGTEVQ